MPQPPGRAVAEPESAGEVLPEAVAAAVVLAAAAAGKVQLYRPRVVRSLRGCGSTSHTSPQLVGRRETRRMCLLRTAYMRGA